MNTKETILARAAEIIAQRTVRQDKDSFCTLITIDQDGSPVPTTISPSRSEGIRWITFCTGRGHQALCALDRTTRLPCA